MASKMKMTRQQAEAINMLETNLDFVMAKWGYPDGSIVLRKKNDPRKFIRVDVTGDWKLISDKDV